MGRTPETLPAPEPETAGAEPEGTTADALAEPEGAEPDSEAAPEGVAPATEKSTSEGTVPETRSRTAELLLESSSADELLRWASGGTGKDGSGELRSANTLEGTAS